MTTSGEMVIGSSSKEGLTCSDRMWFRRWLLGAEWVGKGERTVSLVKKTLPMSPDALGSAHMSPFQFPGFHSLLINASL